MANNTNFKNLQWTASCGLGDDVSQVGNFYNGATVFVTGGTGFVGKALIEKLLRSCPGINTIYILIRPKRGKDIQCRFEELLKNPVFDRIRFSTDSTRLFDKVVCINGDVSDHELGLSAEDKQTLCSEVNVVFHSAATVKFNESLRTAVTLNTLGTRRVIDLCRSMDNLKAMVHVSTAYSNADKMTIQETVYKPPGDPDYVINCCLKMSEEDLQKVGRKLQGKHPNTYTMTKAMAEWVVSEQADDIPVAIVRPSIVTAAWKEPFEGWVDNISGITGIMMEIGRGTIRSIVCDQKLRVDIIPVDILVNTLITSAWHTAVHRQNAVRVYNCTSGALNPLRWEELGGLTQYHSLAAPSKYLQWYPGFSFRTNRMVHRLCEILFHFVPAFVLDIVLRLTGSKPMMLNVYRRFKMAARTGEFFALHQWHFISDNIKQLNKDVTSADRRAFPVDVTRVVWDSYVKDYVFGIRNFVLKDPPSTIPAGLRKLQKFYWLHRLAQCACLGVLMHVIKLK
ncbi:putative fatty acyl-CoA reductase CG5065 [Adelges cooleyi]|uniref:putative fatty acyl-CoA reductase CG5065 n=1 Tax=Adelges cooleyi TaxID=133065 RepID=UPI00218031D1|nr:putative fatty acyl-CoA reductase CG5065 [Adelges cooleyi]